MPDRGGQARPGRSSGLPALEQLLTRPADELIPRAENSGESGELRHVARGVRQDVFRPAVIIVEREQRRPEPLGRLLDGRPGRGVRPGTWVA